MRLTGISADPHPRDHDVHSFIFHQLRMPPCENNLLKGRASAAYERAMSDFESRSDATWHSLLRDVLVRYVTHLTNPEGPALSAPMLTKQQILQSDNARKEARTASAAAAASAAESGGDSGGGGGSGDGDGDSDCDDAASAHGDENKAALPAAAKEAGSAAKGKLPAGGRKGPRTRTG